MKKYGLTMYMGSMRAGKSGTMLRLAEELYNENASFCIVRTKLDNRGFLSRSYKSEIEDKLNIVIGDEIDSFDKYEHYLIDEIQFYNTHFIDKLIRAIGEAKSAFYTFGITADVYSRLWHNNARLIPYADEIVLLKADCELCEKPKSAIYNVGEPKIGDEHKVVCPKCAKKMGVYFI